MLISGSTSILFLRWVDLNNMLVLPLISIAAFYLLKKVIEGNSTALIGWQHLWVNLAFIVGIYLLAASYGTHEVTNYMHARFCLEDSSSDLCRIVIFNDDEFSHWVFFSGFVLVNAALLFLQALFAQKEQVSRTDSLILMFNALFLAAGILANLGFEEIGLDLYVVGLLAG